MFGRPYAKALRIMPEAMDDQEPLPVSPVCPFGSIEELFSEPMMAIETAAFRG